MVEQESFVTRRPIMFLIIFLIILVLLYIPVRISVKAYVDNIRGPQYINETYEDVWKWFKVGSPLNIEEKRELFWVKYDGNDVYWEGTLKTCKALEGIWTVSVDHGGSESADVIFSTKKDCSGVAPGSKIKYKMRFFDFKVNVFVGENGEIIE